MSQFISLGILAQLRPSAARPSRDPERESRVEPTEATRRDEPASASRMRAAPRSGGEP